MICDDQYQNARTKITEDVTKCINSLIAQTRNKQGRVTTVFSDMYFKLKVGIAILVVWMFVICMVTRKLLVKPLLLYNKNIAKEQMLPPIGAEELQQLGETYNMMYRKHRETQKLIRHQAEHDVQTDLLNRRSFEKILRIYEEGENPGENIFKDADEMLYRVKKNGRNGCDFY